MTNNTIRKALHHNHTCLFITRGFRDEFMHWLSKIIGRVYWHSYFTLRLYYYLGVVYDIRPEPL